MKDKDDHGYCSKITIKLINIATIIMFAISLAIFIFPSWSNSSYTIRTSDQNFSSQYTP